MVNSQLKKVDNSESENSEDSELYEQLAGKLMRVFLFCVANYETF